MNNPTSVDSGKSLWKKPEGIGLILIAAILAGCLFYWWGEAVPFIMNTLMMTFQSIWYMAAAIASILFLAFIATNKELHNLIWNIYKMCIRGVFGMVIELNPIAILRNSIADMKKHLEKLQENMDALLGAKAKLDKKIDTNQHEVEKLMGLAQAAKNRFDKATTELDKMEWNKQLQLNTIHAGGLKDMNLKLLPLQNNMAKMCDFLKKASWAADFTIQKAEIDVELREAEWNAVQTSSKALNSAMSAMNGSPEQRELLEQTLEFMENDMAQKVGQMKRIMDVSNTFINAADLENDAQFTQGMAMLDNFMNGGEVSLISDAEREHAGTNQGSLGQAYMPSATLSDATKVSVQSKW